MNNLASLGLLRSFLEIKDLEEIRLDNVEIVKVYSCTKGKLEYKKKTEVKY
jgi:hypothetical protein